MALENQDPQQKHHLSQRVGTPAAPSAARLMLGSGGHIGQRDQVGISEHRWLPQRCKNNKLLADKGTAALHALSPVHVCPHREDKSIFTQRPSVHEVICADVRGRDSDE